MIIIDNNISFKIKYLFIDKEIDCVHVEECKLQNATDLEIWNYAKNKRYIILSKDNDFWDIYLENGFPPKVILLKCGNKSTSQIKEILIKGWSRMIAFINSNNIGVIEIS